jgi:hypothetical protein
MIADVLGFRIIELLIIETKYILAISKYVEADIF